jgi:cytochrome c-type biogenesis protein CcmH/NrfG
MLRDADLIPSAALSATDYDRLSTLLGQELHLDLNTARAGVSFFSGITDAHFGSPAGACFRPQFEALRALNQMRLTSEAQESLAETTLRVAGAERAPDSAGALGKMHTHDRTSANWLIIGIALAFIVPAGSVWVYLAKTHPAAVGISSGPVSGALSDASANVPPAGHTPADLERMVDELNTKLKDHPDDVDSWVLLGRTLASVERWTDAKEAFAQALKRLPDEPALHAQMGEVLTLEAGGSVTPAALAEFAKAPGDPRSRFYEAVAQAQNGEAEKAIAQLEKLAAEASPGASWRQTVMDELAVLRDRQTAASSQTLDKVHSTVPPH